jgi:hypothetical protein
MKTLKPILLMGGIFIMALALGFAYQAPLAIRAWPWSVSPLTYLFICSILAAVSVAMLWIGWTEEYGALPAGTLNIFVIALTTTCYFFSLILKDGRRDLLPYAVIGIVSIIMSVLTFLWSRRLPLKDSRPTPRLVLISFGIFVIALILAAGALLLRQPIFPWTLTPESSIIFGCIFLGDAFYFIHALLYPRWHNAAGQLLSFLAYDLVLIFPFLRLFETVKPEFRLSLTVYVSVLIYSGLLAVYYLFINRETRILGTYSSLS